MTKVTKKSWGLSLVEVVMTMGLVCTSIAILMNLFMTSQRRFLTSEKNLSSAILAQTVMERLKSQITENPSLFRQLYDSADGKSWSFRGNIVDPTAAPDKALPIAPFFEHLFADTGNLYDDANRVGFKAPISSATDPASKQMQDLVRDFRDYTVAIRIEDDVDPETGRADSLMRELVKVVNVDVSRVGGKAGDTFSLTSRIICPPDSLSSPALEMLHQNFEGATLEAAWDEFFAMTADNEYFSQQYLSTTSKRILADVWIILGLVNTEAFMVGKFSSPYEKVTVLGEYTLSDKMPVESLNHWINTLSQTEYQQHAVFRKELSKLHEMRLRIQFDTYKRVHPVLSHLYAMHYRNDGGQVSMVNTINQITTLLGEIRDKIIAMNDDTKNALNAVNKLRGDLGTATIEYEAQKALKATAEVDLVEAAGLLAEAKAHKDLAKPYLDEAARLRGEAKKLDDKAKLWEDENKAAKLAWEATQNVSGSSGSTGSSGSSGSTGGTGSGDPEPFVPPHDPDDIDDLRDDAKDFKDLAKLQDDEAKPHLDDAKQPEQAGKALETDATKRKTDAQKIIDVLEPKMKDMNDKLKDNRKIIEDKNQQFATLLSSQGDLDLFKVMELVTVVKFLVDFFSEADRDMSTGVPRKVEILDRMKEYPQRMRDSVDQIRGNLKVHLTMSTQTTPYERMRSAQRLVEMTNLHQLMLGRRDDAALAELTTLGNNFGTTLRPLSQYLKRAATVDFTALQLRNKRFTERMDALKRLASPPTSSLEPQDIGNMYSEIAELYRDPATGGSSKTGKFRAFIEAYTQFAKDIQLNGDTILLKMQRSLRMSRNQLEYVADATADEILSSYESSGTTTSP